MVTLELRTIGRAGGDYECRVELPPALELLDPYYLRAKVSHLVENLIDRLELKEGL